MLPQFLKTFWKLVLHNQSNSGIEEHVTTDSQATWERRCSRFLLMDFTDVCGKRKENKPQTLGKLPQVHIFYHWEPLPFYFIILALNPSLLICFRQPYLQRYKNVGVPQVLRWSLWESHPLVLLTRIATLKPRGQSHSFIQAILS